jgi:hypothetical protein
LKRTPPSSRTDYVNNTKSRPMTVFREFEGHVEF